MSVAWKQPQLSIFEKKNLGGLNQGYIKTTSRFTIMKSLNNTNLSREVVYLEKAVSYFLFFLLY